MKDRAISAIVLGLSLAVVLICGVGLAMAHGAFQSKSSAHVATSSKNGPSTASPKPSAAPSVAPSPKPTPTQNPHDVYMDQLIEVGDTACRRASHDPNAVDIFDSDDAGKSDNNLGRDDIDCGIRYKDPTTGNYYAKLNGVKVTIFYPESSWGKRGWNW